MLITRLLLGGFLVLAGARVSAAATDATLLRLFLSDGTALVSYGEFAQLGDRVVFSMPVGGTADEPRLHVVTIPAANVDWVRTERYVASARYQHYAATRGEEDFARLSAEVARVLNEVALTSDPHRALRIAEQARRTLIAWPQAHFGYRQRDVREIVALLDEAMSDLRASAGIGAFDLSFVAMAADVPLEPLYGMPAPREMIDQVLAVAALAERASERVSLLQTALALVEERGAAIAGHAALRESIVKQIRDEMVIDGKYAQLAERWLPVAERAAAQARVQDIEAVLARIGREDRRLGFRRPDVVQALNTSLRLHLDNARRLRLLRDQWLVRRSLFRQYERTVSSQLLQLVKAQPSLDAIKRLAGPVPATLSALRSRLEGGAERLQRMRVADAMRDAHDLLVGAWQFAETAVRTRQDAIGSGDMATAWRASSAAAGALMMLGRVQAEMRSLVEPPQLK